mmetsp:Transcript_40197/g.90747  ORF Transcript_40197/g.90747 Transcript_40197/m.90747 type:complete len:232 (-) Transcript_40197:352-1047(-)
MGRSAHLATCGLLDRPVAQGDRHLVLAVLHGAPEDGRHHVRNEVGASDNDALDCDQALDVARVHVSHDLAVLFMQLVHLHLACAKVLRVCPEFAHRQVPELPVEDWDHLGGEAHKVVVQAPGPLENVHAADGELDSLLPLYGFFPTPVELLQVVRPLISSSLRKSEFPQEVVEVRHDTGFAHVCAVEEVSLLKATVSCIKGRFSPILCSGWRLGCLWRRTHKASVQHPWAL